MTIPETPPRGLGWLDTSTTRAITTAVAIIAFVLSAFLLYRLQGYIDCVAETQQQVGERTRAIASATDAERLADAALIAGATPGGPTSAQLRDRAVAARAVTDRVRAANPAPPARSC